MSARILVRCLLCNASKEIDQQECARLAKEVDIPMCDKCPAPMVPYKIIAT